MEQLVAGYYYPDEAIQVPNPLGEGVDPITSLSFDERYDALYASLPSQSLQPRRAFREHRASMLLALANNSRGADDGGGGGMVLYSSVAGHPEAPTTVLKAAYHAMYGGVHLPHNSNTGGSTTPAPANVTSSTTDSRRPFHVPSHAYRPPYGNVQDVVHAPYQTPKKPFQLGITTLLGLHGHCASVSPSAVRLHQLGGFLETDHQIEGMLCGATLASSARTSSDAAAPVPSHLAVGGLALAPQHPESASSRQQPPQRAQHVWCLDIWEGLRPVASYGIYESPRTRKHFQSDVAVTAMASMGSSSSRGGGGGGIVVGCSDGFLRLLDPRMRELVGRIKSHAGGVVSVATSNEYQSGSGGTLIATTGYGATRSSGGGTSGTLSSLYGFPDPSLLVYDVRYLGRGGISHPFGGMRAGPRFVAFVPDVEGLPANRMVVASGQAGGGLQIVTPFQEFPDTHPAAYIQPPLDRGSITSMCVHEGNLALGTSDGAILRYKLLGYDEAIAAMGIPRTLKEPVEVLPFEPRLPPLSLDASLLMQSEDRSVRAGMTEQVKSIVSTYVLCQEPTVSAVGDASSMSTTSFGPLAARPMVTQSRLHASTALLEKVTHAGEFPHTVPTRELNVNLFDDHRSERFRARSKGKLISPQPNPNKLLYTDKLFPMFYSESLNWTKRIGRRQISHGHVVEGEEASEGNVAIPNRYRLTVRPTHKLAATFNHYEHNETGFLPGWDYPPTMPNSFVPPVLMMFYAVPELLSTVPCAVRKEKGLLPELGYLFHRIDSLGRFGLASAPAGSGIGSSRVGAWAPSNFISLLATMPEADQLQILDDSPAAVDPPRRPEAFYRFLLYQVDKEASTVEAIAPRRLYSTGGVDFVSINEFISGSVAPSHSSTRAMTVDLRYEGLEASGDDGEPRYVRFGEVLQRTLCRETRLRAWSQGSKSYETIVQTKVTTSLPAVLSLCCSCAGRKEEDGLKYWRGQGDGNRNWLPELIEIEISTSDGVIVREFVQGGDDNEAGRWIESVNKSSLPQAVADIVSALTNEGSGIRKRKYRLEAVLSIVRDDMDRASPEVLKLVESGATGHLVLHTRVRNEVRVSMLEEQIKQLEALLDIGSSEYSLLGAIDSSWRERLDAARERLAVLQREGSDDEWILVNGFVVSNTIVEDATAFHVRFKEPSLVVYRALDADEPGAPTPVQIDTTVLPVQVMRTVSLTDGTRSILAANQVDSELPGRGDLVAFDAEFVSVQEEEASLTETGSKVVVRETRYAVGRVSVMDCRARRVIVDDYVLPREPVVDYLTRFSGIVPKDLDPKQSARHLVTTRDAYRKLRHLIERGCVFVGHGLLQDFWTVNLAVPPWQVIDTVEIYHRPALRYISLRFLTNFVLKRDMQQTVHDSVEDAMAAFELYRKAVELKEQGAFDKLLDDLYEYGNKNDWKLGGDDEGS